MNKINISLKCFSIGIIGVIVYIVGVVLNLNALGGWNLVENSFIIQSFILPMGYAILLILGLKAIKYSKIFGIIVLIWGITQPIYTTTINIILGVFPYCHILYIAANIIIVVSSIQFLIDYKNRY